MIGPISVNQRNILGPNESDTLLRNFSFSCLCKFPVKMGSIHHSYADCKLAFERLIQVLDAPNRHFGDQMPAKGVLNEYGRFKVWSGSVGANHPPQKRVSLDYRLKDSQFYGDNVLDIISRLADTLQKGMAYFHQIFNTS